ncbi:transaminase type I [Fusarium coicis]|nr:transaminase type I [Fusarium coicis]
MVHITPFAVEQWMDAYETTPGVLNVAETCAASVSIDDLVAMSSVPAKNPIDTSIKLTYGAIPGSQTLRERIAVHCSTEGVQLAPEDVIVTQGAIGANFLALYTLIGPGDHVICVYPTYQQLYDTPRSLGAQVTLWKLKKKNGFVPDVDELADLIKPNTKMIIINNPNNPTGAPIPNRVIDRIAKVAEDKGIILFSDEVYRPLFHGGASGGDHTEVPRPVTTLNYQKTIVSGSMSKGYALAGIRVGWIASRDRSIISAIMLARDYTTISVSQIDDQIARFALSPEVKPALVQRNITLARTNAAILKDFMDRYKSVCSWVEPKAGTTAFIRFNDKNGDPVDDIKLCLDLLEKAKLLFVAGSRCFGGDEDFKGYRKLIADDAGVSADDVLITSGAAGALFIITTSQLGSTHDSERNHLVVVRPNYANNLETPEAVVCEISYIDITFENGFQPNIDDIEAAIKPNTRLVSVTYRHNHTGSALSREALDRLVAITKKKGVLVLVDETYRDIAFAEKLPVAASLGDHDLSVCSVSKSFGMPGVRIGWLITTNKTLEKTFFAAKEQISISGSVINEWIAIGVLSRREKILSDTTDEMRVRLQMVESWIESEELLEWVKPTGGVVCFPCIKQEPKGWYSAFYERLLNKHATYVGPGHWFEMSDGFFRLGYGWPTRDELEGGMKAISAALRDEQNT